MESEPLVVDDSVCGPILLDPLAGWKSTVRCNSLVHHCTQCLLTLSVVLSEYIHGLPLLMAVIVQVDRWI